MAKLALRLMPETVRTVDSATIAASPATYIGIGSSTVKPIRMVFIQNLTDTILMFSFDGINDHFPLPTTGYIILDITANKTLESGFFLAENQRIYVRDLTPSSPPPTVGDVYVTTFYGADV